MSHKQSNIIERDGQTLEVSFYYHLGGMNYFTGNSERRGFYLSVCPVQVTKIGNNIRVKSYTAFSGIKECVMEAKRYSEKVYQEAITLSKEKEEELIKYVLSKQKVQ